MPEAIETASEDSKIYFKNSDTVKECTPFRLLAKKNTNVQHP